MNLKKTSALVIVLCGSLLFGCGKKTEETKKGPPPAIISVTQAESRNVEVVQMSVGVADSDIAPTIAAEVSGRVDQVMVDTGEAVKAGQILAQLDARDIANALRIAQSDVRRLEALVENQHKLTERNRQLAAQNFISPTRLDEIVSQEKALFEQLNGARANADNARRDLDKTRIAAPVNGRVEARMVSKGDFVTIGKPMFQISTEKNLRVRLPFPESVVSLIKTGQRVQLTTPTSPDKMMEGKISEIRSVIGSGNRAFEAMVEVANPGDWRPGASVNGAVVVAERPDAVVVPEISVVQRPAGMVVYVVKDGKATQRIVQVGERRGGVAEIVSGLRAGEVVAMDGAGFLTDKASVVIKDSSGVSGSSNK